MLGKAGRDLDGQRRILHLAPGLEHESFFLLVIFFLKDEAREKAEALLKKLHVQCRRSGTEAVLRAHRLDSAECLRVIGKPAHLLVSLYEHPSISQRIQNPSGRDYPGEDKTLLIFLL